MIATRQATSGIQHGFDKVELLVSIIRRSQQITRAEDIKWWLRSDARHLLPHGALVVAWGDFPSGELLVRRFIHDPAWSPAAAPRIATEESTAAAAVNGNDVAIQTLQALHGGWVGADSQPCVQALQPDAARSLIAPKVAAAPLWPVSHGLTHAMIHGVRDRRSDYDCLYAFLGNASLAMAAHQDAARLLVPCLETALRRATTGAEPAGLSVSARPLSIREREIIRWVQEGKTNEEIGLIIGISSCTVKNHLQRIFKKLNVSNRAQAAMRCRHMLSGDRERVA